MSDSGITQSIAYIKRNPSFQNREEFYDYWRNTHGPLCTNWLQEFGIIGYTQV
jgi:hypothetical protein